MSSFRFALRIAPFALIMLATVARAKVPSPANCDVPRTLLLVGRGADGTADPIGDYRVVVRDAANNPEDGAQVTIDFSDCTEDRIGTDQSPLAGANCPTHSVISSGVTAADGSIHLRVVGWADHRVSPMASGQLKVLADGVVIAMFCRVAALDQDGGGMGASDLAAWLDDFFHAPNAIRSDFDGDGSLTARDLSTWLGAFFAGGSVLGGGPSTCPP